MYRYFSRRWRYYRQIYRKICRQSHLIHHQTPRAARLRLRRADHPQAAVFGGPARRPANRLACTNPWSTGQPASEDPQAQALAHRGRVHRLEHPGAVDLRVQEMVTGASTIMSTWIDKTTGRRHAGGMVDGKRLHRILPEGATSSDAKRVEADLRGILTAPTQAAGGRVDRAIDRGPARRSSSHAARRHWARHHHHPRRQHQDAAHARDPDRVSPAAVAQAPADPVHHTYEGLKTAFQRARIVAEMPWVNFHDLRHSCASILMAKGADLYTVSKILGHSTIATSQRYSHVEFKQQRDALKRAFS